MAHTLFFCSLSPPIARHEAGLAFELVNLDPRTEQTAGADWRSAAGLAITTAVAGGGLAP